jgi:hypothetical protein
MLLIFSAQSPHKIRGFLNRYYSTSKLHLFNILACDGNAITLIIETLKPIVNK